MAFIQIKNIDILNLKQLAKKNHIEPVVSEAILLAAAWLGIKLVRDAELAGLNSRKKLLEKRLVWGKKGELSHSLWQQLSKRFLMNAFCSHAYIQMRLWIQVTLGTIIMTLSKAQ